MQTTDTVLTLNIEHHKRQLVISALNSMPNMSAAAVALGITVRTLHNYVTLFDIERVRPGVYQFKKTTYCNGKKSSFQNRF